MVSSRLPTLRGRELVLVGSLCGSWRSTSVWEEQGVPGPWSRTGAPAPPADQPQGACTGWGFGPAAGFGQSGEEPRRAGSLFTLLQPRGMWAQRLSLEGLGLSAPGRFPFSRPAAGAPWTWHHCCRWTPASDLRAGFLCPRSWTPEFPWSLGPLGAMGRAGGLWLCLACIQAEGPLPEALVTRSAPLRSKTWMTGETQ